MTEDEAQGWIVEKYGVTARDRLALFVDMVMVENERQNLISAATLSSIWVRHVVDSAQLVEFAKASKGDWIDIGTGAGFPGIVTAILTEAKTLLAEPRKRRVEFLGTAINRLDLGSRVSVVTSRIESVADKAAVITARAVASLTDVLAISFHCADAGTVWLLPKGRRAHEEVALARQKWHGTFHVEQSITDPASQIVIASKVSRR